MASRKKKSGTSIVGWLIVIVLLVGVGAWLWLHREQLKDYMPQTPTTQTATSGDKSGDAVRLKGRLRVVTPARDPELGISADAVVLFRIVEMYQWLEQCNEESVCDYSLRWSRMQLDSNKFREPKGHENPRAPFASARFDASEVKLGEFTVDAAVAAGQRTQVEYPVKADSLAPNLAASFTAVDGLLYAGGDPAHPQPGTLRIRYRVIPPGEAEITGVRRGNRIEAK